AMAFHSKRRANPLLKEYLAVGEPLLEAQVVDAADSLAYDTHDLDDALGTRLLKLEELNDVESWRIGTGIVRERAPHITAEQHRPAVVRALIEWYVSDLVNHTRSRLGNENIDSIDNVRRVPDLVGWSPSVSKLKSEVEGFLRERVYKHPS